MKKTDNKIPKAVYYIIFIIIILYAAIFAAVALLTIFLPTVVYDDQKLLAGGDSASKIHYSLSIHDGITSVNCSKMTGTDTLWSYHADKDRDMQMYYIFQVTKGKAKIILVNPDDTIITLAEQSSAASASEQTVSAADTAVSELGSMAVLDLKKGENRIKIACEKGTAFSLSFHIP